jgi:AAA+ ATPase superfamily predicted ATPase
MDPGIVDRERELNTLHTAAASPSGQLVIVWGRRRVGKTYLLQEFVRRQRCVYYTATQQSGQIELAAFTDAVRAALGSHGLPPGYAFPDWSTALDWVTDAASGQRLVVVLDEFPYLAASAPGLESVVQRWWDQRGRTSPIMLVLCGSAVAYMAQIVSAAAPLHQRATASLHVQPLDYRAAAQFVGTLPAAERAVVYGILGGIPLYLSLWDARVSRRANLVRLFGDPASPLVDAAELMLSGELPELEGAFRILQAVALGHTRQGQIAQYADVAVERPLKRLTTLGILERRVPVLDDPARSRRAIYRIVDPYFAFWFRFIASRRADIARGLGEQLVDGRILPQLDDYMGGVFEEIARAHVRYLAAQGALEADRVDAWWSADGSREIDIVGVSGRRDVSFIGSVKWSTRPLSRSAIADLQAHASGMPGYNQHIPHLLVSRRGCGASVAALPEVSCYAIDDLYA